MMTPQFRRLLRVSAAVAVCFFVSGLAASWFVADALIAPAPHAIGTPPGDLRVAEIALESESGSMIRGWHTRGEPGKGVVVLLHGIRANRLTMARRMDWLGSLGYSTVAIDFQAHGESPGKHITIGYLERHDVRAAVEFARHEHPGEPIGVLGQSLGGAAALLVSPLNIDALVLESVYTDIDTAVYNRVQARLGPLAPIASKFLTIQLRPRLGISPSQLRPIDHIAEAGCPVYILSGTIDRHTTLEDTNSLHARAAEPKELWLVEGAAHVDLMGFATDAYQQRIAAFFGEHLRHGKDSI